MTVVRRDGSEQKSRVTKHELNREARRILPILAKPGAHAIVGSKQDRAMVSINIRKSQKRPTAKCDGRILLAFHNQEWVKPTKSGKWCITAAGVAFLARQRGGEAGFRAQHQEIIETTIIMPDGSVGGARLNTSESPLGWLRRHKAPDGTPFLSEKMVASGDRLRSDFTRAHLSPSITSDWARIEQQTGKSGSVAGHGSGDLSDSAIDARQRFERAVQDLGPEMSGVAIDVCCFLKGLGEVEKSRGWPKRSAKLVLRLGLYQLARHYGMITSQSVGKERRPQRAWRRNDAKSSMPD